MDNIFSSKMATKSTIELEAIVNSEGQYVDKAIQAALEELQNRNQLSKKNSTNLNDLETEEYAKNKQLESAKRRRKIELKQSLRFYFDFFAFRTNSKIVPLLIYINLIVYGLMLISGIDPMEASPYELLIWGGNLTDLSLNNQPWRLITYSFLHINLIHIFMNLIILGFIGPMTEFTLGKKRFILTYLMTGIGAGIASALLNNNIVSVGASGSIFGLFGVMMSLILISKEKKLKKELIPNIIAFLMYNFAYGLMNSGIDNAAHAGGFITGILLGIVFRLTTLRNISVLEKITQANNG